MEPRWVTSLQHPDRCQVCGTSLPRGIPAWWDASTGQVWCEGCRPGPGPEAFPEESARPGQTPPARGEQQDRWSRLVGFLRRCLQVGSAWPLTPLEGIRWAGLPLDSEAVLCQATRRVPLHPKLDRLAGRLRADQILIYGWPTVVFQTDQGLAMAPLFAAEMLPPPYSLPQVPLVEEPVLNPALVAREAGLERLRSEMGDRLPLGDGQALAYWAERCGEALGVPVDLLDPGRLRPEPGRAPGLYNAATVLVAENPPAVRALLDELGELQGRTDWTGTAAACLLDLPVAGPAGRDGMVAAAFPVDRTWEEALVRVRSQALVPLASPPGSGASRLALAAVAQAWLDGDSVLVCAPREETLEGLLSLARRLHPGLLLPTGSLRHRQELVSCLRDLLRELEADSQVQQRAQAARDELEQVARQRQTLHHQEQERARVRADLSRCQRAQAQAAARVWGGDLPQRPGDPGVLEHRARGLERAWLLARFRQGRFLRSLAAIPQATIGDVRSWAKAAQEAERAVREVAALPPEDGAVREACEATWRAAGARALVETTAARLHAWSASLHVLADLRPAAPGLPQALQAALPGARGWACDLGEVGSSLSLEAGLFDLGLVVEAGACSLAATLPLAYRCRRLALLGDPGAEADPLALDPARRARIGRHFGFRWEELDRWGLDPSRDTAFTAFWRASGGS